MSPQGWIVKSADRVPVAKNSTRCYTAFMASQAGKVERVFKTAWFGKAAKKASIRDVELCSAIKQVMLGQADDLGGGV